MVKKSKKNSISKSKLVIKPASSNNSFYKEYKWFIFTASIVLFLDQIVKFIIRQTIPLKTSIFVLPFFHLTHITNTGAGFSIFQGNNSLLAWIGVIVFGFIIFSLNKANSKEKLLLGIVSGGILGNLVDRVFFGAVTDFLDFLIWPIFNLADTALSIGIILLVFNLLKSEN